MKVTRTTAILAAVLASLAASGAGSAGVGNGTKIRCDAGRGNGFELLVVNGVQTDCDPGNSGPVNHGGDFFIPLPG